MRGQRLAWIAVMAAIGSLLGSEHSEARRFKAEPHVSTSPVGHEQAVADALSVDPGATCLEHDRLTEQVVTWLERDALDSRLTIGVDGDPDRPAALRFTLYDRGTIIAEREFDRGPSRCNDLHSVVGLAIALAVDATVLESVGIPTEPEPEQRTEPEPEPEPEPAPAPLDDRPRPELGALDLTPRPPPWVLRIRGGAWAAVGMPPPVGGGAELGVEFGWREIVDLYMGALVASAGPQPTGDATIDVTLMGARLDVCAGPWMGRVRPRFCSGALVGGAVAEGRGFTRDFQTMVPWVAGVFGGDLRVALGSRLALSFDLDGIVSVLRPVFNIYQDRGMRQLRELPRFGAGFGVGLVFAFGEGRRGAAP